MDYETELQRVADKLGLFPVNGWTENIIIQWDSFTCPIILGMGSTEFYYTENKRHFLKINHMLCIANDRRSDLFFDDNKLRKQAFSGNVKDYLIFIKS